MLLSGRAVTIVVVAAVALLVGYALYTLSAVPGAVTSPVPTSFTVNGKTYNFTYVATTPQERQQGLMNSKITNMTMELFAFPQPVAQPFWMYQTNASLDMIWIMTNGDNGTVVYLVTSAQPCFDSSICTVYTPDAPANYVIEAKAGFAAANGIEVGTTIHLG